MLLRLGPTKTQLSVDPHSTLGSSAVQMYNQSFIVGGAWLTPNFILPARFARVTAQIDF